MRFLTGEKLQQTGAESKTSWFDEDLDLDNFLDVIRDISTMWKYRPLSPCDNNEVVDMVFI